MRRVRSALLTHGSRITLTAADGKWTCQLSLLNHSTKAVAHCGYGCSAWFAVRNGSPFAMSWRCARHSTQTQRNRFADAAVVNTRLGTARRCVIANRCAEWINRAAPIQCSEELLPSLVHVRIRDVRRLNCTVGLRKTPTNVLRLPLWWIFSPDQEWYRFPVSRTPRCLVITLYGCWRCALQSGDGASVNLSASVDYSLVTHRRISAAETDYCLRVASTARSAAYFHDSEVYAVRVWTLFLGP